MTTNRFRLRTVALGFAVSLGFAAPVRADAPAPADSAASFPRPPGERARMAERPVGQYARYAPGKGLTIATADRHFSLTTNLGLEFLYTYTDRWPTPAGQPRGTNSFEVRRARLFLSGNAISEHLRYYTQLQFAPRDLGLGDGQIRQSPVFMAWVALDRLRDLVPQVGFFFIPYSRQRVQPVFKLQFPDFSLASAEFGLERDIGVDLGSRDLGGLGKLRYHVGAYMGDGTDFARANDTGFTYVGRLEAMPLGDFDDYVDSDHMRRRRPAVSIGAGYAFSDRDHRNRAIAGTAPTDGGTTSAHNATVDVMFKVAGVSILADGWFRHGRRRYGDATIVADDGTEAAAPRERARNGAGWTAQAGWLLPRIALEVAARYSAVRGIDSRTSLDDADEIGPGLSYYFAEHAAKLQLDYGHGWVQPASGPTMRSDRMRLQLTVGF